MSENSMYPRPSVYLTLAMPISRALYTSPSDRPSLAWYTVGILTRVCIRHRKLDTILVSNHSEDSDGTVPYPEHLLHPLLVALVLRVVHREECLPPHPCEFEVAWITKLTGQKSIARCSSYQEAIDTILQHRYFMPQVIKPYRSDVHELQRKNKVMPSKRPPPVA